MSHLYYIFIARTTRLMAVRKKNTCWTSNPTGLAFSGVHVMLTVVVSLALRGSLFIFLLFLRFFSLIVLVLHVPSFYGNLKFFFFLYATIRIDISYRVLVNLILSGLDTAMPISFYLQSYITSSNTEKLHYRNNSSVTVMG